MRHPERLIYVMIDAKTRKSIVRGWIETSPEFKAVQETWKEAGRYIAEQALASLTDKEKKYLEVFGLERTKTQGRISYHSVGAFAKEAGMSLAIEKWFSFGSCIYNGRTFFDRHSLRKCDQVEYVDPGNVPLLFLINQDDIKRFKEEKPEIFLEVTTRLVAWFDALYKFNEKLKGIGMILTRDDITLTLLKKYLKNLYDGRKREETEGEV